MILTVTLNPAVDKMYRTETLMTGQVNRMSKVISYPGGKGINVTKVLHQLGKEVIATGFLGGFSGRYIDTSLKKMGIDCEFVEIQDETRSSINVVSNDGYVTEILEPGPNISTQEQEQFFKRYQELLSKVEIVVLSGSIAKGMEPSVYAQLIEMAKTRGRLVLLDTSGEALKVAIGAKPFLIKPNGKELESLAKERLADETDIVRFASELNHRGINEVVVSLGKAGLIAVDSQGGLKCKSKPIKVVNTVGSGDSVVAAYAAALEEQRSREDCIRFATAVSAAHTTTMENGNISLKKVEEIYLGLMVGEIPTNYL